MRRCLAALTVVMAVAATSFAATPAPRPLAGRAVLAVPEAPSGEVLTVYAEPGVQRVAQVATGRLPRLSREGAPLLAALARRGNWLKVSYDEAERQGWIEAPPRWRELTWEEVLEGSRVRVLPGLKKPAYQVRAQPGEGARECGTVVRDQALSVVALEGDWARLAAPAGWLRWRDAEGRLAVAVDAAAGAEKR